MYKDKGDKNECKNYRDINLLCGEKSIYKIIIVRVITYKLVGDEQAWIVSSGV